MKGKSLKRRLIFLGIRSMSWVVTKYRHYIDFDYDLKI
jgi:hypothetical protein